APRFGRGTAAARMESARVQSLARTLRERALDRGDLLNRIAFLYGVVPAVWPRALAPEQGLLAAADPDMVASRLPAYSRGLERARLLLEEREASDRDLAERVPAIQPIATRMAEPAAFFAPRVAPWTGGPGGGGGRVVGGGRLALDRRAGVLPRPRDRRAGGLRRPGRRRRDRALRRLCTGLTDRAPLGARQHGRRLARRERRDALRASGED